MLARIIHLLFLTYTILIFIRVTGSWFPRLAASKFMNFVRHYTDPYLNLFRRIIPPIGGALDLSPLLGYFLLQFAENFLLRMIR